MIQISLSTKDWKRAKREGLSVSVVDGWVVLWDDMLLDFLSGELTPAGVPYLPKHISFKRSELLDAIVQGKKSVESSWVWLRTQPAETEVMQESRSVRERRIRRSYTSGLIDALEWQMEVRPEFNLEEPETPFEVHWQNWLASR